MAEKFMKNNSHRVYIWIAAIGMLLAAPLSIGKTTHTIPASLNNCQTISKKNTTPHNVQVILECETPANGTAPKNVALTLDSLEDIENRLNKQLNDKEKELELWREKLSLDGSILSQSSNFFSFIGTILSFVGIVISIFIFAIPFSLKKYQHEVKQLQASKKHFESWKKMQIKLTEIRKKILAEISSPSNNYAFDISSGTKKKPLEIANEFSSAYFLSFQIEKLLQNLTDEKEALVKTSCDTLPQLFIRIPSSKDSITEFIKDLPNTGLIASNENKKLIMILIDSLK